MCVRWGASPEGSARLSELLGMCPSRQLGYTEQGSQTQEAQSAEPNGALVGTQSLDYNLVNIAAD